MTAAPRPFLFITPLLRRFLPRLLHPEASWGDSGMSCLPDPELSKTVTRRSRSKTNHVASEACLSSELKCDPGEGYYVDLILKIQTGSTPTPILPFKKKRKPNLKDTFQGSHGCDQN